MIVVLNSVLSGSVIFRIELFYLGMGHINQHLYLNDRVMPEFYFSAVSSLALKPMDEV